MIGEPIPGQVDYSRDLTAEQRTTAKHCQLFLDEQGDGFSGNVGGHQVRLTYSGGGYRGFIDGDKHLTPDQAQDLYLKYVAVAKAQTLERFNHVSENDPETQATVDNLLAL